ncbi:hypothetical protein AX17_005215 [Amanita inopinata Kibby_2008]|nr:hypothetical protein AX17_005215 [Amanita inopinata Kibby_2008]
MAKSATNDVQKLLKSLHDTPVDNDGASDGVLGKVYTYLMNVSPSSVDRRLHWYCDKADAATVAAASFLLRLFAYNSPQVENWKNRLIICLRGCCECVRSLERVKVDSRHTYFGAFPDDTMKNFYKSFEDWELDTVLRELSDAKTNGSGLIAQDALANISPATIYRMLFNWIIFTDTRIQSVILRHSDFADEWPKDTVPPGILLLLFHKDSGVRQWARNQASKGTMVPLPKDRFVGMYKEVVRLAVYLVSPHASSASQAHPPAPTFSTDSKELWEGFYLLLRHVPMELLKGSNQNLADLRQVVVGHLHDVGPQFAGILHCLLLLLKRLGVQFWSDEGHEYPQVVFDAVKDNPAFAKLLEGMDSAIERHWYLAWFGEYLHTICSLPVCGEVLAKMVDFLCEEMQHERFKDARPLIMNSAMRLLIHILRRRQDENKSLVNTALGVIDIHVEVIISVAFSRAYKDEKWTSARSSARLLVSSVLVRDIEQVSSVMTVLCAVLAEATGKLPVQTRIPDFSIRKQIWGRIYPALQTNDIEGLATIISTIARASHIDVFSNKPFLPTFKVSDATKDTMTPEAAYNAVNGAISAFSDGFLSAMTRFGDCNISTSAFNVLQHPGTAKDLMLLLLSPVEQIQDAAKTFITLAFDVDGRLECFRALIQNLPDAALEGIADFLNTYVQFAVVVPEACSLSGSLVRCFTDIIDVLCASPDGLLRNLTFLRPTDEQGPAAQLPKLWVLMTKSLAVIFKHCPSWSVYFENEEMIVWMRDALIFGRDMLAQWRIIEKAASSRHEGLPVSTSNNRLSAIGKKMVNSLQEILPELARWLRLTDEELLHQSFALIQSLLDVFRDTGIPPSAQGISKLTRHIESAKKDGSKHVKTRLDAARLSALANAIASFEDDDDDIEIVSFSLGHKKDEKAAKKREVVLEPLPRKSVPSKISNIQSSILKYQKDAREIKSQKASSSRYFTEEDQRRLDESSTVPVFKKSTRATAPGTSSVESGTVSKKRVDEAKAERKVRSPSPSSSESSDGESQDDESHGGLSALAKFQKSPKIKKQMERRQIKTIDIAGVRNPVNVLRERRDRQEEARRIAYRMKPDLSGLHKVLLSWNYNHDGPMPSGNKLDVNFVPDVFKDYSAYRQVFEPLLLMECWAQICQAKGEPHESYDVKINSRQFIDDWLELELTLDGSVKKDWYLSETDVVLLRHPVNKKCIMAKTQSYRTLFHGIQINLRCFLKNGVGDPGLQIHSVWQLSKVFSLSTIHREYAALVSLPYYDFLDTILHPNLPLPAKVDHKDVQSTMSKYGVNEPQATAILSSLETSGFSLIQGPPGTGKTSTICGLIAVFLSRRTRPPVAVHAGKSSTAADKGPASKILICAPSNAAIDEIAYRIKEGYRGSKRRHDNAKVVRIGAERAISISVKDISLDTLVDQKLNASESAAKEKNIGDEVASLRRQMESVKELRSQKLQELTNLHDNAARSSIIEEELKRLNSERMKLTQNLDRLKDQQKSESRTLDAIRRRARLEVLQEADIVCSTLSGAGHDTLDQFDFDTVVIDEAAQAIELSSLIPLRYRCNRCIMVGDPQQLPPTVISQEATRYHYNQSLFVRLQKQRPDAIQLLSIQYRMHPEISRLPSRVFYQNRLQDGPDMAAKTAQPWHLHPKFGTYKFFNIKGTEEQSSRSLVNKAESQIAAALYARLRRDFTSIDLDFRIGVVSMYRAQVSELRRQFERHLGERLDGKIDFNTVDGFQGQEKDIIILSCVRGGTSQDTVGFLADLRRMNVALTRAKSSLFILGNVATLERSNTTWAEIITDARSRSCLIEADFTYFTSAASSVSHPTSSTVSRKLAKPAPVPIAVPSNLATPKDLKASVDRANILGSSKQAVPAPISELATMETNGAVIAATDGPGTKQIKRHIEDADDSSGPPQKTSRTSEPVPKPRVLPKKPKQQTMFIPKKKRP